MALTLAIALLGLTLGLKISSRMGAAFLTFSGVVVVHVLLATGPQLLRGGAEARRIAGVLYRLGHGEQASILNLTCAALAGLALAMLLQTISDDRRIRNWDPDRRSRRGRRHHAAAPWVTSDNRGAGSLVREPEAEA